MKLFGKMRKIRDYFWSRARTVQENETIWYAIISDEKGVARQGSSLFGQERCNLVKYAIISEEGLVAPPPFG